MSPVLKFSISFLFLYLRLIIRHVGVMWKSLECEHQPGRFFMEAASRGGPGLDAFEPSRKIRLGWVVRLCVINDPPEELVKNRKFSGRSYKKIISSR